jgi:hypothetical protein
MSNFFPTGTWEFCRLTKDMQFEMLGIDVTLSV